MRTKVFEGKAAVNATSGMKELVGYFVAVADDDRKIVEMMKYAVVQAFTSDGAVYLAFNSPLDVDIHPTALEIAEQLVQRVAEIKALTKRLPKL